MNTRDLAELPVRWLGRQPYMGVWDAMRDFTEQRNGAEDDQLWVVEHDPVFTQGLAGKPEHLLFPGDIAVVQTDRGGQVTYHGPGQVVIYTLLDIKHANLGPRALVTLIENATIQTLTDFAISSHARADAPGVYVKDGRKIASLGLKIRRGRSYHGVAINVAMDLSPFAQINPCGLIGMQMAQVSQWQGDISPETVARKWVAHFSCAWYQSVTQSPSS